MALKNLLALFPSSVKVVETAAPAPADLSNFVKNGKKIMGVAINYIDNLRNYKDDVPKEPILFIKPTSSYVQDGENIVLPAFASKVIHAVELGFIISRRCKRVTENEAMDYVGGYCLALHLKAQCELERAQCARQSLILAEGFDTSTAVSRLLCAEEFIEGVYNTRLWLRINGRMRQDGNTSDMYFRIPRLIAYASQFLTLEENDLFLTGTPDGESQVCEGDRIECGLGELQRLKFVVVKESSKKDCIEPHEAIVIKKDN